MPVTTFTISAVDTVNEVFTATGHNQAAGTPVFISAETTLPTGLTLDGGGSAHSILYYISADGYLDANNFRLADRAGALVTVSSGGVGALKLQIAEGSPTVCPIGVYGSGECEVSNVPLPLTLTVAGLVAGSKVRLTKADDSILYAGVESGGVFIYQTTYKGLVNIEARKTDASPYYKPWFGSVTLFDRNQTAIAIQISEE